MMNPYSQHGGIIMHRNRNASNPVCCAVIPSNYGVPLVLTIWIGLSMYFSTLSFMGRSPFYSHIDRVTLIIFGILNLLLVALCLFGYTLQLVRRSLNRYRAYAKLTACCVSAILLDTFINFVVFCVKRNEFYSWCQNKALDDMTHTMQQQNIDTMIDLSAIEATVVFNCNRLFTAEAKFGFIAFIFMTIIYVYWTGFINKVSHNFIIMRPTMANHPPHLSSIATETPTAVVNQQRDFSNHDIEPSNIQPSTTTEQSQQHSIVLL